MGEKGAVGKGNLARAFWPLKCYRFLQAHSQKPRHTNSSNLYYLLNAEN